MVLLLLVVSLLRALPSCRAQGGGLGSGLASSLMSAPRGLADLSAGTLMAVPQGFVSVVQDSATFGRMAFNSSGEMIFNRVSNITVYYVHVYSNNILMRP